MIMAKKTDWDEVARQEYEQMDAQARRQWKDLRAIVYGPYE